PHPRVGGNVKDPRRLLEDVDLPEVERRSLQAAISAEPPPELVGAVWTELSVATGTAAGAAAGLAQRAAPGDGAPGAASVVAAGGKMGVLKALALGAAVGVVTTGGTVVLTSPSHESHPATGGARVAAPGGRQSPPARVRAGASAVPESRAE